MLQSVCLQGSCPPQHSRPQPQHFGAWLWGIQSSFHLWSHIQPSQAGGGDAFSTFTCISLFMMLILNHSCPPHLEGIFLLRNSAKRGH